MSEAEEAWRLWHLLQVLSDELWNKYESAFMDFCGEDMHNADSSAVMREQFGEEDLPF